METNDFVPDVVYGLGGGGTELALQFLEQDWVLDRIIEPRTSRSEDLTVRLLDTATEEMNAKEARVRDIRTRRDELQDRYHGARSTRPGDVTVEPYLVTRNMNMMNATVLTGRQEVAAIAESTGIDPDDWWPPGVRFDRRRRPRRVDRVRGGPDRAPRLDAPPLSDPPFSI